MWESASTANGVWGVTEFHSQTVGTLFDRIFVSNQVHLHIKYTKVPTHRNLPKNYRKFGNNYGIGLG